MTFDWRLYIELADELIKADPSGRLAEAYYRSAISRMYYGVFCLTRERLTNMGIRFSTTGEVHKEVREVLTRRFNSTASTKLAKKLGELHTYRKKADYDSSLGINTSIADGIKKDALECLAQI